jgi:hypothetical protein
MVRSPLRLAERASKEIRRTINAEKARFNPFYLFLVLIALGSVLIVRRILGSRARVTPGG